MSRAGGKGARGGAVTIFEPVAVGEGGVGGTTVVVDGGGSGGGVTVG